MKSPKRLILGIAIALGSLWGGCYLLSLSPDMIRCWWAFPYVLTSMIAMMAGIAVGTRFVAISFENPFNGLS